MKNQEDRKLDLIDELWARLDDLEPGQGVGSLFGVWAERALAFEIDERSDVLAFLEHAKVPKSVIDLIAKGIHRQRSTKVMKALKAVDQDRKKQVEDLISEYVGAR